MTYDQSTVTQPTRACSSRTNRPESLTTIEPDRIPEELKALPLWTLWRPESKGGGGWRKPPVSEAGRYVNAASARLTFAEATAAAKRTGFGIGIWADQSAGLCFVDVDHCVADGRIAREAQQLIADLGSYAELSPSGTGIRIVTAGRLKGRGKRGRLGPYGLEVYADGQFLTITGRRISATDCITTNQPALDRLAARLPERTAERRHRPALRAVAPLQSDAELIDRMMASKLGHEVLALWNGGGEDRSRGDFQLCRHLAFWTRRDANAVDRLFRQSLRMRAKWDERRGAMTYGERTVLRAIDTQRTECREPTRAVAALNQLANAAADTEEVLTVRELGERLGINRYKAARHVVKLNDRGLARRVDNPLGDRRAEVWRVKAEGWRLLFEASEAQDKHAEGMVSEVEIITDADLWLAEWLSDGPRGAAELQARAAAGGLTRKQLRRARLQLGVTVEPRREGGKVVGWVWSLGSERSEARAPKTARRSVEMDADALAMERGREFVRALRAAPAPTGCVVCGGTTTSRTLVTRTPICQPCAHPRGVVLSAV